ncbi:MAG: EscU/YscU/HrcU family type III secretion system export apparatus switch protein [Alicyclobacillus sp.]|nr:EscU/YscU/HrcU family type III secretion system export apparatus switch protein [Alicyclobacillus sp.]
MEKQQAVALRYEAQRDQAPRVVARGAGAVADALVDVARRHQVPVLSNAALVSALMDLEVGDVIPEELYAAVAEILAFVYRMGR